MVIKQALAEATQMLKNADIPNPRMEANLLLCAVLQAERIELLRRENEALSEEKYAQYLSYLKRRCDKEPTAYILENKEFMSLNFRVTPAVLIPRPDTEILCEAVLQRAGAYTNPAILDLCCGSGCIGISLAHFLPKAQVTLMDLSEAALQIATENAKNIAGGNTQVVLGDALSLSGTYDIIASNPPYIETEIIDSLQTDVCCYEPHMALDGGPDGMLFYTHFAEHLQDNLHPGGMLALEVGHTQARAVRELLLRNGWKDVEILCDLSGIERVVLGYKN